MFTTPYCDDEATAGPGSGRHRREQRDRPRDCRDVRRGRGADRAVARRAELLDEVAAGIGSRGGEALPVPTDLTQEHDVIALFDTVRNRYGRLDVLVNNAGVTT